jgi:hypothetical protein
LPDPGVDPAPRIVGGVAAPSEIAAGVPADLDLIARMTLRDGQGPVTPGELANQIAPWSSQPIDLGAVARPALLTVPVAAETLPFGAVEGPETTGAADARVEVPSQGGQPDGDVAPTGADTSAGSPGDGSDSDEPHDTDDPLLSAREVLAKGLGAAVGAAGSLGSGVRHRVGTFARAAADKAAAASQRRTRPGEAHLPTVEPASISRASTSVPDHEPPAPFLPSAPHTPTRDQSKLAIGSLVALVIVAFVVALGNLPPFLGGSSDHPDVRASVTAPSTTTGTTTGPTSTSTASGDTSAPVTKLTLSAVTAYDPEGDGQEGETTLARAWDGDQASAWRSQWYVSASYGGLKSGLGLLVDLGATRSVTGVQVTLQGKQTVEVFVGAEPSKAKAVSLGKTTATGLATFTAKSATAGRYVVIWVTGPTPAEPGKYRAQIAEIAVIGRQ